MTRRYYGFHYFDGVNTTTGGEYIILHVAGRLYYFSSARKRDAWVSEGYSCPVPRDVGEHRRAVTTRNLPLGWSAVSADTPDADAEVSS